MPGNSRVAPTHFTFLHDKTKLWAEPTLLPQLPSRGAVKLEDPWVGGDGPVSLSGDLQPRKRGTPNSPCLKSMPPFCVLSFRSARRDGSCGEEAAGAEICSFRR